MKPSQEDNNGSQPRHDVYQSYKKNSEHCKCFHFGIFFFFVLFCFLFFFFFPFAAAAVVAHSFILSQDHLLLGHINMISNDFIYANVRFFFLVLAFFWDLVAFAENVIVSVAYVLDIVSLRCTHSISVVALSSRL